MRLLPVKVGGDVFRTEPDALPNLHMRKRLAADEPVDAVTGDRQVAGHIVDRHEGGGVALSRAVSDHAANVPDDAPSNVAFNVASADLWYLREKYATGRISLEQFSGEVDVILDGGSVIVPAGDLQELPPGPERLVAIW